MRNKRWDLRRAYKSPGRLKSEMYTFVTRNHESKKKVVIKMLLMMN